MHKFPMINFKQLDEITITVEFIIPGYSVNDFELTLVEDELRLVSNGSNLIVDTNRVQSIEYQTAPFYTEFKVGKFNEILSATLTNGVLSVVLGRNTPDNRKIEVQVG